MAVCTKWCSSLKVHCELLWVYSATAILIEACLRLPSFAASVMRKQQVLASSVQEISLLDPSVFLGTFLTNMLYIKLRLRTCHMRKINLTQNITIIRQNIL